MNQKKCKDLRKKAKEVAPQEQTMYDINQFGVITLNKNCVRAVYQNLKQVSK